MLGNRLEYIDCLIDAKTPKGLSFRNDNAPLESISPHCDNKYICQTYWRKKAWLYIFFFSHHGQCPLDHTKTPNHKQMQNAFFFSKSMLITHLFFKDDEINVNYFQTDL